MIYPPARREDVVDVLHGREVADPYRWLEEAGSAETRAWLEGQARLLAAQRESWPAREWFRATMKELKSIGMVGTPVWAGGREFVLRRAPRQEHAVLYVDGRALIDPNAIDPTGATTLDAWYPSKEGDRLAYAMSVGGSEQPELRVIDVDSGELLDGPIGHMRDPSVAWVPGGESFYYTRFLESSPDGRPQLHRRLHWHTVGADPAGDALVMGEAAPVGRYLFASTSHDGRWLTVRSRQGTDPRVDIYIAELGRGSFGRPEFVPVQRGVDALATTVFGADTIYLHTNLDAPRGRICVASAHAPGEWRDLVVADQDSTIDGMAVLDELATPLLVVARSRHAVSELSYHDLRTGAKLGDIPLPGMGQVTSFAVDPRRRTEVWFRYTDYASAPVVFRFDGVDVTEHARPQGFERHEVAVRQVTYESTDGTPIRMFVIGGQGLRPCILYGYGGFNNAPRPGFSDEIVAWVRSGGVYAVASLRGGSEEGEAWHRAGMLGNKQNGFDDYLAASDWLVENGITTRDRLAFVGGSNGGLLVGAAMTQRPQACAAVVCSAPLLDMVRYERFGLGMTWSGEYGRATVAEEFDWLLAYSPYHHVDSGVGYPAVLFSVFEGDTRVDPMHARKMAAALQYASTGPPIVFRSDSLVGHGSRAVTKAVEMSADKLGFVSASVGHLPR